MVFKEGFYYTVKAEKLMLECPKQEPDLESSDPSTLENEPDKGLQEAKLQPDSLLRLSGERESVFLLFSTCSFAHTV